MPNESTPTRDLMAEGSSFLSDYLSQEPSERVSRRQHGVALAHQLRRRAIDLCYDKATESSPDIPALFLLAAKIACLFMEPESPELSEYEKDVLYYKNFNPPHSNIADEYEAFKASHHTRQR